jgi:hypothetical protein
MASLIRPVLLGRKASRLLVSTQRAIGCVPVPCAWMATSPDAVGESGGSTGPVEPNPFVKSFANFVASRWGHFYDSEIDSLFECLKENNFDAQQLTPGMISALVDAVDASTRQQDTGDHMVSRAVELAGYVVRDKLKASLREATDMVEPLAKLISLCVEREAFASIMETARVSPTTRQVPKPHPSRSLRALCKSLQSCQAALQRMRRGRYHVSSVGNYVKILDSLTGEVFGNVDRVIIQAISHGGLGPLEAESAVLLKTTLPVLASMVRLHAEAGVICPALFRAIEGHVKACLRAVISRGALTTTNTYSPPLHFPELIKDLARIGCLDADLVSWAADSHKNPVWATDKDGRYATTKVPDALTMPLLETIWAGSAADGVGENACEAFISRALGSFVDEHGLSEREFLAWVGHKNGMEASSKEEEERKKAALLQELTEREETKPKRHEACHYALELLEKCCQVGVPIPRFLDWAAPMLLVTMSARDWYPAVPTADVLVYLVATGQLSPSTLEAVSPPPSQSPSPSLLSLYHLPKAQIVKALKKIPESQSWLSSPHQDKVWVGKSLSGFGRELRRRDDVEEDVYSPWESCKNDFQRVVAKLARTKGLLAGLHLGYQDEKALLQDMLLRHIAAGAGLREHGMEPLWWCDPARGLNLVIIVETPSSLWLSSMYAPRLVVDQVRRAQREGVFALSTADPRASKIVFGASPKPSSRLRMQEAALRLTLEEAAATTSSTATTTPLTIMRIPAAGMKSMVYFNDGNKKAVVDEALVDKALEKAGVWKLLRQKLNKRERRQEKEKLKDQQQ